MDAKRHNVTKAVGVFADHSRGFKGGLHTHQCPEGHEFIHSHGKKFDNRKHICFACRDFEKTLISRIESDAESCEGSEGSVVVLKAPKIISDERYRMLQSLTDAEMYAKVVEVELSLYGGYVPRRWTVVLVKGRFPPIRGHLRLSRGNFHDFLTIAKDLPVCGNTLWTVVGRFILIGPTTPPMEGELTISDIRNMMVDTTAIFRGSQKSTKFVYPSWLAPGAFEMWECLPMTISLNEEIHPEPEGESLRSRRLGDFALPGSAVITQGRGRLRTVFLDSYADVYMTPLGIDASVILAGSQLTPDHLYERHRFEERSGTGVVGSGHMDAVIMAMINDVPSAVALALAYFRVIRDNMTFDERVTLLPGQLPELIWHSPEEYLIVIDFHLQHGLVPGWLQSMLEDWKAVLLGLLARGG